MKSATVTHLRHGEEEIVSVSIREVGRYSVPRDLLEGAVRSRALEVVDISVAQAQETFVLEARTNVVTSELLTDRVRLQIEPKVPPQALDRLLSWATLGVSRLEGPALPLSFARSVGVYGLFVGRFLRSLQLAERSGWIPASERKRIRAADVQGTVDPLASTELLLTKGELTFEQTVSQIGFGAEANRVIRTALEAISRSGERLSSSLVDRAAESLSKMPECEPYRSSRRALTVGREILTRRSLDGTRSYFYDIIDRALPILSALSRRQAGDVTVEDTPIRIRTDEVFEDAVRNLVRWAAPSGYRVVEGGEELLYAESEPRNFNVRLDPDVVVRPVGDRRRCSLVIDAKYKERGVSAADQQQLAAYIGAYNPEGAAFVTVDSELDKPGGIQATAETRRGTPVTLFSLSSGDLVSSARELGTWMHETLNR